MELRELDQFYRFLKLVWKQEVTFKDKIQEIENPDQLIPRTKELLNYLTGQKAHISNPVFKELFHAYYDRVSFMINDFLSIRSKKIVQKTQNGEFVDEDFLLELELPFYNSLIKGFQGYQKTVKFALSETKDKAKEEVNLELPTDIVQKQLAKSQYYEEEELPEEALIDEEEYEDFLADALKEQHEDFDEELLGPKSVKKTARSPQKTTTHPKLQESSKKKPETQRIHEEEIVQTMDYDQNIEMIAVRFLNKVNSLVGQDFRVYGPFQKGDIAFLPKINADILLNDEAVKPIKMIR